MEKQEMLAAWTELQNRVEKYTKLQVETQKQINRTRGKSLQNRMQRTPIVDLVFSSVLAVIVGNFVADHAKALLSSPVAALPSIGLFGFAVMLINLSIRQLVLSSELDYAKPVLDTQVHLAKLRKLRLQSIQWPFLYALPLWFMFPLFLGQMLIGPKLVSAMDPAWIIGNVVFGLAMFPVLNWATRKSRFALPLQNAFAGKDIAEAESFLQEIRKFEEI